MHLITISKMKNKLENILYVISKFEIQFLAFGLYNF